MSQPEPRKAPLPDEIVVDGEEREVSERFHELGLTDGLPIIAPTRERVDEMCSGSTHYPMESLGRLAPRGGVATVQKIAINAVMAGCRPEHMPVLEAAVRAIQEGEFNLFGMQTTTHPCGLLAIVQGPLAVELAMNSGAGCMGPGNRANASLGRAIRLILMNVGGAIPGRTDKATQGTPAKYSWCFAENEVESPWPPLRTTLGIDRSDSCVTVAAAEGPHNINDHGSTSAESILETISQTMSIVGVNNLYVGGDHFVVLGPEHAQTIAKGGFSRKDVQHYFLEHARVSVDRIPGEKLDELTSWGGYADQLDSWQGRIPLVREVGSFRVLVAGGPGKHSCWIPTFAVGYSQTAKIERGGELCRIQ